MSAQALIDAVEDFTFKRIRGRFFKVPRERTAHLSQFLSDSKQRGAFPVFTFQLAKTLNQNCDAIVRSKSSNDSGQGTAAEKTHLQIIMLSRKIECLIWLFLVVSPKTLQDRMLIGEQKDSTTCDDVTQVHRDEIIMRWPTEGADLSFLMKLEDPRWRTMNVMG